MNLLFKPVTKENWETCVSLKVDESQKGFVAENWYSIIEASFEKEFFPTCIYVGDMMIGFLMYDRDPETKRLEVSRFMIDQNHQGKGYGKASMTALLALIKETYGPVDFYTSAEPENEGAIGLYESLGFERTGEVMWGEVVLKVTIT
ncbi:GNAT family N-acetyltransferase [Halobacillus aidingensis]|uniref:Diamine N-acetyltransferase n=1 Tax=Halobacillus aidingensis TaxID=240303 RepID=A0A1H0SMQ6_HALAD|nr:GNAT family N-acetyltransferase [Halobacillus aidingensis]SDP43021.1 diamine N-acetyltransferase [Halobacillus aidingensis]